MTLPTGVESPVIDLPAAEAPIEDALAPLGLHALAETDIASQLVGEPPVRVSLGFRIATLAVVILPFVGAVTAMALLWGVSLSWIHLVLFGVGYILTGLGVTIGYHRYFTHKSFDTHPIIKAALGILGSVAVQGPIVTWVAAHRKHHQHSDRHDDPHSPHQHGEAVGEFIRGFIHAHCGWLIRLKPVDIERYAPDLVSDKLTRRISQLFPLWVLLGLLVPTAIALAFTGTWSGALLGLLWGGAVRIFFVHHITWSVNSVCHLWGRQAFRSRDHSRNNVIFGVLALGEGWHNNHHAFPTSARHGLMWWQFDISYLIIRAMERLGLVWNVRVPSPVRITNARLPRD
ncbi:MAG TPA: acyl-CoA desaturase [Phycisphaerales bacterium]|nr:acyl-CoA desaturase [Phycisphaerales bacterium]